MNIVSHTGDVCHFDIENIYKDGDEEAREKFSTTYCKPPFVFMCNKGVEQEILPNQFDILGIWITENSLKEIDPYA